MCAIYGFISRDQSPVDLRAVRRIIHASIDRGPHAFGFAWIDRRGTLRAYRQQGRMVDHLSILAMLRDARSLVGHLRYATHGEPGNNVNNHPHPVDGGWLVHNGVVHNYHRLLADHQLSPVSDCDSELFGLLAEQSARPSRLDRMAAAINQTHGPCALLSLWPRPDRLLVARRGNPLHYCNHDGGTYFSTLSHALPQTASAVPDNRLMILRRNINASASTALTPDRRPVAFSSSGTYRGG